MSELRRIGRNIFGKLDFLEWADKNLILEHSGQWHPFSLKGHEPLKELYEQAMHPYIAIRKAAQLEYPHTRQQELFIWAINTGFLPYTISRQMWK